MQLCRRPGPEANRRVHRACWVLVCTAASAGTDGPQSPVSPIVQETTFQGNHQDQQTKSSKNYKETTSPQFPLNLGGGRDDQRKNSTEPLSRLVSLHALCKIRLQ